MPKYSHYLHLKTIEELHSCYENYALWIKEEICHLLVQVIQAFKQRKQ